MWTCRFSFSQSPAERPPPSAVHAPASELSSTFQCPATLVGNPVPVSKIKVIHIRTRRAYVAFDDALNEHVS